MDDQADNRHISDELEGGADSIQDTASLARDVKNKLQPGLNQPKNPENVGKDNIAQYQPEAGTNAGEGATADRAAQKGAEGLVGQSSSGAASAEAGAAGAAGVEAAVEAGATAAGAEAGATAGAEVGTAVAPGAGTAVGAVVGALIKPVAKAGCVIFLCGGLFLFALIAALPQMLYVAFTTAVVDFVDNVGDRLALLWEGDENWNKYEATPEGMLEAVTDVTKEKHREVLQEVDALIREKGWDRDLTEANIFDTSRDGKGKFDGAYIVAAYSYIVPRDEQTTLDLRRDMLDMVLYSMDWEEKTVDVPIDTRWPTYTLTRITYMDEYRAWHTVDVYKRGVDEIIRLEGEIRPVFEEKEITNYVSGEAVTTKYYTKTSKTQEVILEKEAKTYGVITISPDFRDALEETYDYDEDEVVGTGKYGAPLRISDICRVHAINLLTVAGYDASYELVTSAQFSFYGYQSQLPLTKDEATAILDKINGTKNQEYLIYIALSGVGRIPYYWAGRSPAGWNTNWGNIREPSANPSGVPDIYDGLDCSGFVEWVYKTAYAETATEDPLDNYSTYDMIDKYVGSSSFIEVDPSALQPGDVCIDRGHTAIFLWYNETGDPVFIHENGGKVGCEISTRTYKAFKYFIRFKVNEQSGLPWLYEANFGVQQGTPQTDLAKYDLSLIGMDAATFEFASMVLEAESSSLEARYYIAQIMQNRVNSLHYPNDVLGVLTAPGAFRSVTYNTRTGTYQVVYPSSGTTPVDQSSTLSRGLLFYVFCPDDRKEEYQNMMLSASLSWEKWKDLPADVTYFQPGRYIVQAGYEDYEMLASLYFSRYNP